MYQLPVMFLEAWDSKGFDLKKNSELAFEGEEE